MNAGKGERSRRVTAVKEKIELIQEAVEKRGVRLRIVVPVPM